ncbi:hypothetical protein EG329_009450 [Mollisiaceae sp. DMI_Dod_QoI]|nr:hypothetical protein EG329_009450 [Helotiales sp. DMI_Dod_QoI]
MPKPISGNTHGCPGRHGPDRCISASTPKHGRTYCRQHQTYCKVETCKEAKHLKGEPCPSCETFRQAKQAAQNEKDRKDKEERDRKEKERRQKESEDAKAPLSKKVKTKGGKKA